MVETKGSRGGQNPSNPCRHGRGRGSRFGPNSAIEQPIVSNRMEPLYERFCKQAPVAFLGGTNVMKAEQWLTDVTAITWKVSWDFFNAKYYNEVVRNAKRKEFTELVKGETMLFELRVQRNFFKSPEGLQVLVGPPPFLLLVMVGMVVIPMLIRRGRFLQHQVVLDRVRGSVGTKVEVHVRVILILSALIVRNIIPKNVIGKACFQCGIVGHFKKDCPQMKKEEQKQEVKLVPARVFTII
uniref:CCHC-type domain-containing protein n=1 Tax=Cannabis sativa TaxID=3483 RepID=A0A803PVJ1_CANSA